MSRPNGKNKCEREREFVEDSNLLIPLDPEMTDQLASRGFDSSTMLDWGEDLIQYYLIRNNITEHVMADWHGVIELLDLALAFAEKTTAQHIALTLTRYRYAIYWGEPATTEHRRGGEITIVVFPRGSGQPPIPDHLADVFGDWD